MFKHCPGIRELTSPQQIIITKCPNCGSEVEFFGDEFRVKCPNCGHIVRREASSVCVSWCQYAIECIENLKNMGRITEEKAEELIELARKTNPHLKK